MIKRYNIKLNNTLLKSDIQFDEYITILNNCIKDFENTNKVLKIKTTSVTKKEIWENCGFYHNLTNVYEVKRITINIISE